MSDESVISETENAYHEDPVINGGLAKLESKAAFYNLAHQILTGKFDQNFAEWKSAQSIDEKSEEVLPDLSDIQEWLFTEATTNGLLLFQRKLNDLMTVLLAELFGRYAKKNVRGQVPADTDLGEVRADLVKTLNGVVTMIEAGILEGMTVKMVLDLPTIKKFGGRREDGTWIIPNAPTDKSGEVTVTTGALRAHNTNVKFVVDGVLFERATLGIAVKELFGVEKPAEIAEKFDNWSADYFAVGAEEPKKAILHNGRKVWLTKVG